MIENYKEYEVIEEDLKNWKLILSPYQKSNNRKAFFQLLNTFIPFLIIWIIGYLYVEKKYLITLLCSLIAAFFLARIFIIQHDCGHQSFFNNKQKNNWVGVFCSLFSFIPFRYWAKIHNLHHAHIGQYEDGHIGDIKIMNVEEFQNSSTKEKLKYRIYRSPFVLFFIGAIYYVFFHIHLPIGSGSKLKRKNQKISLFINNSLILLVYIILMWGLGVKKFLLTHMPILILFSIMAIWFFYIQHQHEENYKMDKKNWSFLLAGIKGSSFYKLPPLFMWLTGNIGYHHIHHLNPLIPNYNLEKCSKENPILQKHVTILSFKDSINCVSNKLWDKKRKKMVGFKEL